MNKEQLKQFENQLMEKRRTIIARKSEPTDASPEYGRDEGDRAIASQSKEMTWLLNSQDRALLQLVDAACSRIRDGRFGECQHCGQEIGLKRLIAIPWTQYCITC